MFELHGEKVIYFIEEYSHKNWINFDAFFLQIYDYFYWLNDDSKRKERILEIEEYTVNKYINQNKQKNDWEKIRKIFKKSMDYELYSDVQYHNWFIFYKYFDFSKSIYQPYVEMAIYIIFLIC